MMSEANSSDSGGAKFTLAMIQCLFGGKKKLNEQK
jgi:hypothetical protein